MQPLLRTCALSTGVLDAPSGYLAIALGSPSSFRVIRIGSTASSSTPVIKQV